MDPDTTLKDALDLANAVLNDEAPTYPDNLGQDATQLAEALMNLHTWLAGGGMLPSAWHLSTCMAHDCRVSEVDGK